MDNKDWTIYFPYASPRKQQEDTINKVLESFKKDNKKYAIVECGTGVGKSAIGLTIASVLCNDEEYKSEKEPGAYFLTTQRILQDQYEKDFSSKGLISLSSASNYNCTRSNPETLSCKEMQERLRAGLDGKKTEKCKYECVYKLKKKQLIEEKLGITNFSYFLTEKNFSNKLPDKKVLVVDEAHNLENELSRFVEISFSEYFSNKILKLNVPDGLNTQIRMLKWVKSEYLSSVNKKVDFMTVQIEKLGIKARLEEFKKIFSQLEMLRSHRDKVKKFLSLHDKDNWVFEIEVKDKKLRKFIFKPIDISHYAKEYLLNFADYVIFMSATIISHEGFIQSIGLDKNETISIKEVSPFPIENRPVLYSPAGSMSAKNIDNTLPILVGMVKTIINAHKKEKGIIHTHNIRIANYLKDNLKSRRIIVAYGSQRERLLNKHINSNEPTILISPSMSEGVDLRGKQSEFQILCKVPFPYLGDKVIRKKMNKWKWWYNTQTVRTIVQSIGRSIRSENDKAVTYILDKDWERISSNCKDYFPPGFFDNYHEY